MGVDKIEIDDSLLQLGSYTKRTKEFINIKSSRTIKDYQIKYSSEGSMPLFAVYIGVHQNGVFYQRLVYNWLDLIAIIGGFLIGFNIMFYKIISVFCYVSFNAKLVKIIFER